MKLGLHISDFTWPGGPPRLAEDLAAIARAADDAGFDRSRPEFHSVYYGAGLAAFEHLLAPRGYALVACVSAGNNAFFVRSERLRELRPPAIAEAYRPRRFAEHRALDGSLTGVVDVRRQLETIRGLPLVDVRDGSHLTVGDLLRVRDGACELGEP